MKKSEVQIYGIVDPRTDKVSYVGQSKRAKTRHSLKPRTKPTPKIDLLKVRIQEILDEGMTPECVILETTTHDNRFIKEHEWISKFDRNQLLNKSFSAPKKRIRQKPSRIKHPIQTSNSLSGNIAFEPTFEPNTKFLTSLGFESQYKDGCLILLGDIEAISQDCRVPARNLIENSSLESILDFTRQLIQLFGISQQEIIGQA